MAGVELVDYLTGKKPRILAATPGGSEEGLVVWIAGGLSVGAVTIAAGATSFVANEDDPSANLDAGAKMLAVRKGTPANTSGADGDYEFLQMSAGRLWTSAALEAGTNNIGSVVPTGAATGGLSIFHHQDLDNTAGGRTAKASAGTLYGVELSNTSAAVVYVKVVNATSATVGTTTPTMIWAVPAYSLYNAQYSLGLVFGTGITFWATTGVGDSSNADPGTNAMVVNVDYK